MPRLSCWFIRAALLHLAIGVSMGGLILSAKGFPGGMGWAWLLLPAHIQLLIGGWLLQLAIGMAYWILPRLDGMERGRAAAAWTSFAALNGGVIGAALTLLFRSLLPAGPFGVLLTLFALAQLVALAAFGWHALPRLRPIVIPPIGTPTNH